MSENSSRSENESNPSNEYLLKEIAKIKEELNHLKNLKDKTFRTTKSKTKRKPVRKRVAVKRKTVAKRKPVRKRVAVKRKPVRKRVAVKRKIIRRK